MTLYPSTAHLLLTWRRVDIPAVGVFPPELEELVPQRPPLRAVPVRQQRVLPGAVADVQEVGGLRGPESEED